MGSYTNKFIEKLNEYGLSISGNPSEDDLKEFFLKDSTEPLNLFVALINESYRIKVTNSDKFLKSFNLPKQFHHQLPHFYQFFLLEIDEENEKLIIVGESDQDIARHFIWQSIHQNIDLYQENFSDFKLSSLFEFEKSITDLTARLYEENFSMFIEELYIPDSSKQYQELFNVFNET